MSPESQPQSKIHIYSPNISSMQYSSRLWNFTADLQKKFAQSTHLQYIKLLYLLQHTYFDNGTVFAAQSFSDD